MAHLKAHELLDLQEHIRSEAAIAASYRGLAGQCQNPQLRRFIENEASTAEQTARQLLNLLGS